LADLVVDQEINRYPIIGAVGLFQLKSGRTSAPRLPQALHTTSRNAAADVNADRPKQINMAEVTRITDAGLKLCEIATIMEV
jgi:hypothetical protein